VTTVSHVVSAALWQQSLTWSVLHCDNSLSRDQCCTVTTVCHVVSAALWQQSLTWSVLHCDNSLSRGRCCTVTTVSHVISAALWQQSLTWSVLHCDNSLSRDKCCTVTTVSHVVSAALWQQSLAWSVLHCDNILSHDHRPSSSQLSLRAELWDRMWPPFACALRANCNSWATQARLPTGGSWFLWIYWTLAAKTHTVGITAYMNPLCCIYECPIQQLNVKQVSLLPTFRPYWGSIYTMVSCVMYTGSLSRG
jgi:hypothetical protein